MVLTAFDLKIFQIKRQIFVQELFVSIEYLFMSAQIVIEKKTNIFFDIHYNLTFFIGKIDVNICMYIQYACMKLIYVL